MSTGPESLYQKLKSLGLIKNYVHPEYEPVKPEVEIEPEKPISPLGENGQAEPENPAQTKEVESKNRQEYLDWKSGLSESDLLSFNQIFNE